MNRKESWPFYTDKPNIGNQRFFDINELYCGIEKCLSDFIWPVDNLIAAMVLAGGDYNLPFPYVPHKHFLHALLVNAESIGELVEINYNEQQPNMQQARNFRNIDPLDMVEDRSLAFGIDFNWSNIYTLIKLAYISALSNSSTNEYKKKNPDEVTIDELKSIYNKYKQPQRKFPGPKTLTNRFLQLKYKMNIMNQMGSKTIIEPNPLLYGYDRHEIVTDDQGNKEIVYLKTRLPIIIE